MNTIVFYKDEDGQWRWQATLAGGDTFGAPLYMEQSASGTVRDILTTTVSAIATMLGRA
jgi:hypothetical protein